MLVLNLRSRLTTRTLTSRLVATISVLLLVPGLGLAQTAEPSGNESEPAESTEEWSEFEGGSSTSEGDTESEGEEEWPEFEGGSSATGGETESETEGHAQSSSSTSETTENTGPAGRSETVEERTAARPTGKTDVVGREDFEASGATSLVEALQGRSGIRLDNQCSICNTTRIRLGGLPGDYTLVTVDGIPIYGSLGVAYGLLMMDTSAMERIEILRGANSVIYGSNAVAGVVNLVTRRPIGGFAEASAEMGSFGYRRLQGMAGHGDEDLSLVIAGHYEEHDPVDRDGDDVSEYTGYQRGGLTVSGFAELGEDHTLNGRAAFMAETRQGGSVTDSILESFGDDELRALNETILTRRIEGGLRHRWDIGPKASLDTTLSYAYHEQDSDYEGELYFARQHMIFAQTRADVRVSPSYEFSAGASYRGELLEENVAQSDFNYHQPGVFYIGKYYPNPAWEISHGIRAEWHNEFGQVVVPEAGVRVTPVPILELFVTGGGGFRAPTTFYEQFKGVRPEGYSLVNAADEAERSGSVSGGAEIDATDWLSVSLYGAWTRINNPLTIETISVDEEGNPTDGVSRVEVQSVDGYLDVSTAEASFSLQPAPWFSAELAWSSYFYDDPNDSLVTAPPSHQAVARFDALVPQTGTRITVSAEVNAPIDLEAVYGENTFDVAGNDFREWVVADPQPGQAYDPNSPKRDTSPWYGIVDIRISQDIGEHVNIYAGVDNVFDFHQSDVDSPLYFQVEDNQALFDVIHIWGPLRGRFFYGGLKVTL